MHLNVVSIDIEMCKNISDFDIVSYEQIVGIMQLGFKRKDTEKTFNNNLYLYPLS